MTIKSIVVSVKPFTFKEGDILWSNTWNGLVGYEVTGPIYKSAAWMLPVKVIEGDAFLVFDAIFPGDMGVPGYCKDDRGCHLFRSRLAAKANDGKYDTWLLKTSSRRQLYSGRTIGYGV